MNRIETLKQLAFEKKNFDAFLVTDETNQLYLTSTPGTACLLIPKKGRNTLYVYGVNYEQTKAETKGFNVELVKRGEKLTEKMRPRLKALKTKRLAVDTLSYELYRLLATALRGQARLKMQGDLIWQLRKVKDEDEVKRMRKAGQITVAGTKAAYETIRPGATEIDVAAEIEYAMRKKGGYGTGFETIVASGIRSAYPHGGCAERRIRKGDLVVVDIGGVYEHYRSDMTRTFVAGKPSEKQKKLYKIVRTAQEKACNAVKPKVRAEDVDRTARKIIEKAGFGEQFNHGLGHGVGLEVHEPPGLAPSSKDRLAVGNVVTVEPGIYFPDWGGIRVEDSLLVKQRGSEKLTDGFYSLEAEN